MCITILRPGASDSTSRTSQIGPALRDGKSYRANLVITTPASGKAGLGAASIVRDYYDAWPMWEYLREDPRYGRSFINTLWEHAPPQGGFDIIPINLSGKTGGSYTVAIWAHNPSIAYDETMFSWAKRGGSTLQRRVLMDRVNRLRGKLSAPR